MRLLVAVAVVVALAILLAVRAARVGSVGADAPSGPNRSRPGVTIGDIPRVFGAMVARPKDGFFAVFLFGRSGEPPASRDALNAQFSVESGRAGLDWVLLAPPNIAAREQVVGFFQRQGRRVIEREENDVRYLRVEGDALPGLLERLLREEFDVRADQKMELISEGFVW